MSEFIIEEFKKYKVFLYGSKVTDNAVNTIQLHLPSGTAHLKFCTGRLKKHRFTKVGKKYNFQVYYAADRYPTFIDLIRNEKPLYFYFNLENATSYITTSDEPVGEGE